MRLGIDFGTTRTVIAACDRGNTPVVSFEAPDGTLHAHIPSLAATDGIDWRYGWDAAEVLHDPRWSAVRSFKRALSGADASLHRTLTVGAHEVSLVDLMAGFLSHLREQLAESTAAELEGATPDAPEAMVAVPAGASSTQRLATLAAFRAAGFEVKGLLNEPSAAGVEYAHRYRKSLTSVRQDVLVYDLGGGTFDASRVRIEGGRHRVTAHASLSDLGGADVDRALLALALAALGKPFEARTDWLEAARTAKEAIHPNTRKVLVELGDDEAKVAVADLFTVVDGLLDRTLAAVEPLADDDGLAGVYVVGGGSELPLVARRLKVRFGRKVKRSAYASASVAVGLALALSGEGPAIEEILGRTFGVFREARSGANVAFDTLMDSGHAAGDEVVRRYRAVHNVGHLRFVECDHLEGGAPDGVVTPFADVRVAYDEGLVGRDLDAIPVAHIDRGPVIEERYQLHTNGAVHVTVANLSTGATLFDQRHLGA